MDGWMMAQAVSGCSGKESKIGWETLEDDDPPESFMVCKEAELEWIERNALVMERQDSVGKGGSLQVQPPAPPRYVKTTKPSIIGLPKSQKAAYAEATDLKHRRPTTSTHHLFPSSSKSRSGAAALTEPSSPRVSCIGRVRSRRGRSKKTKKNPHAQSQPPAIKPSRSIRIQKTGFFWASFRSLFGSRPHKHPESEATRSSRNPNLAKADCSTMQVTVVKQFTSGRRSDEWAADLDQIGKVETHRKELTSVRFT